MDTSTSYQHQAVEHPLLCLIVSPSAIVNFNSLFCSCRSSKFNCYRLTQSFCYAFVHVLCHLITSYPIGVMAAWCSFCRRTGGSTASARPRYVEFRSSKVFIVSVVTVAVFTVCITLFPSRVLLQFLYHCADMSFKK